MSALPACRCRSVSTRLARLWAWLLLPLLLVMAMGVRAADTPEFMGEMEYCYEDQCYPSKPLAEAAMRADSIYGDLLHEVSASAMSQSGYKDYFRYEVDDQPYNRADVLYSVGSWYQQPCNNSSPYYSGGCDSEQHAISIWASGQDQTPGCQFIDPPLILGDYIDPYEWIYTYNSSAGPYGVATHFDVSGATWDNTPSPAIMGNNKRAAREWRCQSGSLYLVGIIHKQTVFDCKQGFIPLSASYSGQIQWPFVCRAAGPLPYIYGKIKQTKSCPANGHPCHPATGDKSRAETDFSFAGRTFTRHYHSLQNFPGIWGFPEGWSHTFSERYHWGSYNSEWLVTEEGYYDTFAYADNKKRLQNSPDRIFETVNAGGVYLRSRDASGEIREFDSRGLLIAIHNPNRPDTDVTLVYDRSQSNNEFLHKVVDYQGRELLFEYDRTRKLITRITLPDGQQVLYGYDANRNLVSVDYGNGQVKQYHYHEAGLADPAFLNHLTGITYEDGRRYASFGYDSIGRVTSSRLHGDAGFVATTTLHYDTADQVTVDTPEGTRVYTMQPGLYRRVLGISGGPDPVSNSYQADGRLQSSTDASGTVTQHAYTDTYRSATTRAVGTPQQVKTTVQRDAEHRVTRQETFDAGNVLQQVQSYAYSATGRRIASCTHDPSAAGPTAYVCGSAAIAPAGVRQTTTTYCEQPGVDAGSCPLPGLVLSVDGPRSDVNDAVSYSYRAADHPDCATSPATCAWRKGDLWKTVNALGHTTEILARDGAGRVLSVKDAHGVVTDMAYHPRGWLAARAVRGPDANVETDDAITHITYWPTGLVQTITQPDGSVTTYAYDAAQRLTGIADNAGNTITYTLDNAGNRIGESTKDAAGVLKRSLSRVYNQLGQLATQADAFANPTDFSYDADGNTATITDALGRITDHGHDPLNRLVRTLQDVGGIAAETRFQYDALDNLTRVTDPKGLHTDYAYNGLGDLTRLASPDTGITTYSYDSAGNRSSQTDARGITASYNYDALNRLTGITYPTASDNVSYAYDSAPSACPAGEQHPIGRLASITDPSGGTVYCWNRFGQLVRKVQTTAGSSFKVRYAYNPAGQLQQLIYPDGAVVDYQYTAHGQVSEVGVTRPGGSRQIVATAITHAPFGPITGWTDGNGRVITRSHNRNYQPQAIRDAATGGLDLAFQYDAVGNLTTLKNAAGASKARYGYDALSRLVQTQDGPTGTPIDSYAYDATGNRTSLTTATGTQAYGYPADSHRLATVAGTARSYDAVGNTTAIGGAARTFAYTAANRMSEVKSGGTVTRRYQYNGRGEQVRSHLGTDGTTSMYDEAGHWLGDYDSSSGAPLQQAIWLGDLPIGLVSGSGTSQRVHFIQPDHLGSPRVVIDAARNLPVWTWELTGEAFGATPPNQDPDGDGTAFILNMRFPGQRYDTATGLNYNYFRDYEPNTGRYVQSDPVGQLGGINTYAYANNSSLMWVDSDGLQAKPNPNPKVPSSPPSTPRYPNMPAANDPVFGPNRAPGAIGAAIRMCMNPYVAAVVVGMMIPNTTSACDTRDKPSECYDDEDDDDNCDYQYYKVDIPTCRAISRSRGAAAGRRCYASAAERYAACLSGRPMPPLDSWNN